MTSEKVTFYKTLSDNITVVEQLPKTVTSHVYDDGNSQFLNLTIDKFKNDLVQLNSKLGRMSTIKVFKGTINYSDLLLLTDMEVDDYWYVNDVNSNYCYNGSDWVDIGNFLNLGVDSVTERELNIIEKSPQIYNYYTDQLSLNMRINNSNGTIYPSANMETTDFIEIEPNRTIVFTIGTIGNTTSGLNTTAVYDANKNFIIGYGNTVQTFVTPSNARYIRKTTNGTLKNLGMFYDESSTDFSYWRRLKSNVVAEKANHATNADTAITATTAMTANTANLALVADTVKNIKKVISKQKFNHDTVTLNGRVNGSNGQIDTSNGYITSDFIEIEEMTNTIIIGKNNNAGAMNFNNIAYYDINKNHISGFNTGNANFATIDEYGRLNLSPPSNAKYFRYCVQGVYHRVGIFFNEYSNNFNYYQYYEFNKSKLYGKKVVVYSDSLGAGASNSNTTWLGKLAKKFGFEPINRGIGGSTVLQSDNERIAWIADGITNKSLGEYGEYVSRPSSLNDGSGAPTSSTQPSGTVEITSSMCTDARVNTIPTDAEIIIVLAGTNGMDESSYRLMLQKIYTRCPRAIVLCCSIPFRYNDTAKTQITNVTANNSIIERLCKEEFGSEFVDLKGKEGINQYNQSIYLSDIVHATDLGNERRALIIGAHLNNISNLL